MTGQLIEIGHVTHDVARRRSLVLLTWPDDPERRLSLPISYGTSLDDLPAEAEKALATLSAELAATRIARPESS